MRQGIPKRGKSIRDHVSDAIKLGLPQNDMHTYVQTRVAARISKRTVLKVHEDLKQQAIAEVGQSSLD